MGNNNSFSKIAFDVEQAMSVKYNSIVYDLQKKGEGILVLSLGEVFFDIPLMPINTLPLPDLYHYSSSRGIPELRKKLSGFFVANYGVSVDYEKEILITAGSKAAIYFAFISILNPGDEVLIHEPYWVSYPEQVKLCYGVPVAVPFGEKVYDFEKYITSQTKVIVINNPQNPTGYLYSEKELSFLFDLAKKYNLWVFSDEAYSEFVQEEEFVSFGKIDSDKSRSVIFNSISKNFGVSGWRLGFLVGNEKLIDAVLKINQHLITCAPTILEYYVDRYFYDVLAITSPLIRDLMNKRKLVADFLDEIELYYLPGTATFYFFVSIVPSLLTSEEFCIRLLNEKKISVVPGIGYGVSCDQFIRLSIGTTSLDEIKYAITEIKNLIKITSCV